MKQQKRKRRETKVYNEKPAYHYPQEYKNFLNKWFQKILDTRFFDDYELRFTYKKWDESNPYVWAENGDDLTAMAVSPTEAYLRLNVYIYPQSHRKYVQKGKKWLIKHVIIHEVTHSMVGVITEIARSRFASEDNLSIQEEKLTEKFARLVAYYLDKEKVFKGLK